ncbi:sulfotransferase domain-containing protein [Halioxenophilus aromaticivorans]|uniref:Sulfotransferase domain-containing protein n=1 Tax=Halioxenophilus aromaticivorans TaxID=1306992 RepID=A0AAV3U1P2_9ALTE
MPTPTFIGIGAQKCASTWIYDILSDHPQAALSGLKEVDFFSYKYDHGLQWYERNFDEGFSGQPVVGEISPSYFHEPAVPERVLRHYPNIKLIVSLRNPVKRAISNHTHEIRVGHFGGSDLSLEKGLANNPTYVDQGLYAKHLQRWLEVFPRENVLVLVFEEVIADRTKAAKQIYEFLGIDSAHQSAFLDSKSNPGYVNKSKGLESFRKKARGMVKSVGLDSVWGMAAKLGLRKLYSNMNKVPGSKAVPAPKDETVVQLQQLFEQDIEQLEALLARDFTIWR